MLLLIYLFSTIYVLYYFAITNSRIKTFELKLGVYSMKDRKYTIIGLCIFLFLTIIIAAKCIFDFEYVLNNLKEYLWVWFCMLIILSFIKAILSHYLQFSQPHSLSWSSLPLKRLSGTLYNRHSIK